jgi:hypothetical protein
MSECTNAAEPGVARDRFTAGLHPTYPRPVNASVGRREKAYALRTIDFDQRNRESSNRNN